MTDRLLNVLDPEDLDRSTRTIGWIAGELVGVLIAISALILLLRDPPRLTAGRDAGLPRCPDSAPRQGASGGSGAP